MQRLVLVSFALLSGCSFVHYRQISNTKRQIVEIDWEPMNDGPEQPGDQLDKTSGDPGFICVEPVGPGTVVHDLSLEATVPIGTTSTTVGVGDKQSIGKIYDMPTIVLQAQSQAFQLCLARLAGEITNVEYVKELGKIRDGAVTLVLASSGDNVGVLAASLLATAARHQECVANGDSSDSCDVYAKTIDELSKALAGSVANNGGTTKPGGMQQVEDGNPKREAPQGDTP